MHKSTKIPPALRKEIYAKWKKDGVSQRQLARDYHVDKRVIGRIIERGKDGDFDIHPSINHRYLKKDRSAKSASSKKRVQKTVARKQTSSKKTSVRTSLKRSTSKNRVKKH